MKLTIKLLFLTTYHPQTNFKIWEDYFLYDEFARTKFGLTWKGMLRGFVKSALHAQSRLKSHDIYKPLPKWMLGLYFHEFWWVCLGLNVKNDIMDRFFKTVYFISYYKMNDTSYINDLFFKETVRLYVVCWK